MGLSQIIFIVLFLATLYLAVKWYGDVIKNIRLGEGGPIAGDRATRWKNMILVALGQQKMGKRWIPGLFHLFIYLAFIITQIELIEIFVDGVFGVHRFFVNRIGNIYTFIISFIEVLSVLAFIATIIFLWRRNVKRVGRFHKPEMKGWPLLDANLILLGEIILIVGIFLMNGSDTILQTIDPQHYPDTGTFAISGFLAPEMLASADPATLKILERVGWWLHIFVVFGFLLYLPHSKHLHILFAFPNTYFSNIRPKGTMENMPVIMNEVKGMMGLLEEEEMMDESAELPEFGSNDIFNLHWKNLLDAYSCTECGRCTSVCPANLTGKKLSPRKIMMDVRDRMEEINKKLKSGKAEFYKEGSDPKVKLTKENFDDEKSLFDYISSEELHACTTCNACVEACPVLINPLEIILKLRRYEILTLSAGPQDWVPMFTSMENSGAVWQMNAERDAWIKEH